MSSILIVDDEPDVRLMLKMALVIAGHEITEAGTGDEAIEAVGREHFDAVVLDIHLPDMLGWEVLARIQRAPSQNHVPVVVVTADITQGDDFAPRHQGEFDELLYKPMDPDDLVDSLERAMAAQTA